MEVASMPLLVTAIVVSEISHESEYLEQFIFVVLAQQAADIVDQVVPVIMADFAEANQQIVFVSPRRFAGKILLVVHVEVETVLVLIILAVAALLAGAASQFDYLRAPPVPPRIPQQFIVSRLRHGQFISAIDRSTFRCVSTSSSIACDGTPSVHRRETAIAFARSTQPHLHPSSLMARAYISAAYAAWRIWISVLMAILSVYLQRGNAWFSLRCS
jgi:hypothetical protein